MQDKVYQLTIPCFGDSSRAACDPCDLIFSAPIGVLDDLLRGLRFFQEKGHGLPRRVDMLNEYQLPEIYIEIGKLMGMNWLK